MAENPATTLSQKIIVMAVLVIIITTVTIPIVDDIADQKVIYTNDGFYNADMITGSATHTLAVSGATYTVDGESITLIDGLNEVPLVMADTLNIKSTPGTPVSNIIYLALDTVTYKSAVSFNISINPVAKSISITDIVNGDDTLDDITVYYEEYCFIASPDGEYAAVLPTNTPTPLIIKNKADITVLMGRGSWGSQAWYWVHGDESFSLTGLPVTVTLNSTPYGSYGAVQFEPTSSTSTSDILLVSGTSTIAPNTILVPKVVEISTMPQLMELINLIPLLLLLVPVMMAARMIAVRRN